MTRRFLLLIACTGLLPAVGPAARVTGVDAVGITVADMGRSVTFYTEVLTFERVSERREAGARTVRLRLGEEFIELTEHAEKGRPIPADSRSNDRWFQHVALITGDMDRAYRHLRQHKVTHISPGPQRLPDWNVNAGGIQAFYFRDPDGHALEVLAFPRGKGAAKWHQPSPRLFLGIDHTAITVADTEASLRFYRDQLRMRVAGESENYGPEQERLNFVFGARLRITALRAAAGPGVELLEYITPRDGRPYPAGARANDLIHWVTRFAGDGPGGALRDPDGHAVEIFPVAFKKSVAARE